MGVVIYDLTLLVLFIIFISIFIYKNKKSLGQEGSLILYRTQWGVKLIDFIGVKYKKLIYFVGYLCIGTSYILMLGILFLILQTVYIYLTTTISQMVKAPPIMPLIPYFPKLFGMESFFPPFYFVYFIVAILIVAMAHEFSHGIFARAFGIRIKSTGFAFFKYFPAVLGAFVEQDDKDMNKKTKFEQMSVLSAGVFANLIVGLVFLLGAIVFFSYAFAPAGVIFDTYSYSPVEFSSINSVNGIPVSGDFDLMLNNMNIELNKIGTVSGSYLATKEFFSAQRDHQGILVLYDDAPAINAKLPSIITKINGVEVYSKEKLGYEIGKYSPKDKIIIEAKNFEGLNNYEIVLDDFEGSPRIGIGFLGQTRSGWRGSLNKFFLSFKDPNTYYDDGEVAKFFYDFLWWIVLINILVAFFNMLPLGILDGGRFFYLTIWGITGSEKFAKKSFAVMTYFLLFLLVLLMTKWVFGFL